MILNHNFPKRKRAWLNGVEQHTMSPTIPSVPQDKGVTRELAYFQQTCTNR